MLDVKVQEETANKANAHGQSSAALELRIPLPLHYCAIQAPLRPAGDLQR